MQRAITLANSLPGVDNLSIEDYDGWHFHRLAWTECQPALPIHGNAHIALHGQGNFGTLALFPCVTSSLYTDSTQPGKSDYVLRIRLRMHRNNLLNMTQRLRDNHGELMGFPAETLKPTIAELNTTIATIEALPQGYLWLEPEENSRPTIKASHHAGVQYEISNTRRGGNHHHPNSIHNLRRVCLARAQNDAINERDSLLFLRHANDPGSFDVLAVPHGHNLTPLGGVNTFVPPMPEIAWTIPNDRIEHANNNQAGSMPVIPFQNNPVLGIARYSIGDAPLQEPNLENVVPAEYPLPTLGQNIVIDFGGEPLHDIQQANENPPVEPNEPTHEPIPGDIYFAIRLAYQEGNPPILMPYGKIGQATGQHLSRARENSARQNTDHPLLDVEGRRIEHYVVARYVCSDVRGIEGNTGLRGYLGSNGFLQHTEGNTGQRENVLLFDASQYGLDEEGINSRIERLTIALGLMREFAAQCPNRVDEFEIVRPNILESIGITWDNSDEVNVEWA